MMDIRILVTPTLFGLLLVAEHVVPLRQRKVPTRKRLAVNLAVTGLVFVVGGFLVGPAARSTGEWAALRRFGLCHLLRLPGWANTALGVLLMDLTFYYWHMANHKVSLLWRFHNVHHIDPDLDVSTSFRFHFGEIAYSTLFRVVQVLLLGIYPRTYLIYPGVFAWATMFHHSNLRLPIRLERAVNKVLVTPRMHGVHHSAVLGETDSNYSVLLSWWDRLHRTMVLNIRQDVIDIGVPAYQSPSDNGLGSLLAMPFVRQRNYWRRAGEKRRGGNACSDVAPTRMLD